MTRKIGKGSRWKLTKKQCGGRRKRKRAVKRPKFFEVQTTAGTPLCTWVKRNDLPLGVLHSMKDGVVSSDILSSLKQNDRSLIVACNAHPLTMQIKTKTTADVSNFFTRNANSESHVDKQSVRICDSDLSGSDVEVFHPSEVPPKKMSRSSSAPKTGDQMGLRVCQHDGFAHDFDWFVAEYGHDKGTKLWSTAEPGEDHVDVVKGITGKGNATAAITTNINGHNPDVDSGDSDFAIDPIPPLEEYRIDKLMKDLNNALQSVPKQHSAQDVINAYNQLILLPGWRNKTDKLHFPIQRFVRHLDTTFPEKDNMTVSSNRLQWSCVLCPGSGQDLTKGICYHKQNVVKHFRSHDHCSRVASLCKTTHAVEKAVDEDRQTFVNTRDIAKAVTDDAVITCARKALSFTAVPIAMQVAARAIIMCRGKDPITNETIKQVRKVSKRAASVLERVNAAVKMETIRGDRQRPACVRGRHWVASRLVQLGNITLRKKVEFLLKCPYLSCSADESDTYSSSAPLAAALQGCSVDFKFGNLFMGQSDVAADKSGEGCFNVLRDLFNNCDRQLLKLIVWSCFDGASAMRSTPKYAGLDGKPDGISLLAFLKREIDDDLPNLHGLCHQGDLSLKTGLKRCPWTKDWLQHIKGIYTWFSKSPARKSSLKKLHTQMQLLNNFCTWRMVYPKYYCPTRWIGLYNCLESILKVEDLLCHYVDKLVDDGYKPFRAEEEDPPVEANTARVESDSDSGEDDEDDRQHKDSFYRWGERSWDLVVKKPTGDKDIIDVDARVELETRGRANTWKELPSGNKKTRCKLLSEKFGLTTFNLGIDAVMADILKPYKVLTQRLQTQYMPIGHRVRKDICNLFKVLNRMFLSDTPTFEKQYKKWSQRVGVNEDMKDQVKAMGRQFVYHFLTNMRYRFQPYWKVIMAMETINPCAPANISPAAWDGVRELVRRCMTGVSAEDVVNQLKAQHEMAQDWSMGEIKACTKNLLRYYHDRLAACKEHSHPQEYPLADEFARLIFSLHVASSIIETYFSKTKFIKNLYRASMRDDLATATLHVQQLRSYINDDVLETISTLGIDFKAALLTIEHDLDDLRKKYVGTTIVKSFRDEERGVVRPYRGRCTDAFFSREDGHYLFHVSYDSDSDSEDMEQAMGNS